MKKKILIVAHHLTVGGVQKSLISALRNIDYEMNDVTLYVRKNRLDLLPFVDKRVKVLVNKDKRKYYRQPKAIWLQALISINKLAKKTEKVDALEKQLSDFVRDASFANEAKTYFTDKHYDVAVSYWQGYNTLFVDKYINAKKKVMFYQVSTDERHHIHQETMPHYDVIAVEHKDIEAALYAWYDGIDGKIKVIENYTDGSLLSEMCKEFDIEKAEDKNTLCTCARFSQIKGIDLAVEAAKLLRDAEVDFKWYMVGSGPLYEKIENLVKEYELSENVVLTGMQKNPYPFMNASDIYVQPSYEEGLSIAMLESKILGIPMVSTRTVGGIAMVQDGTDGYLSDINAEDLAKTIAKAITNKDKLQKMKEHLLDIDYSSEKHRYMNDWQELLEG